MILQHRVANAPHEALPYTVYSHSSYSGPYHPRNVCINDPTEQSSRWSSGSHDQSQYITLKLEKPAVVCEILFGKFHRSHVCNLKEFKVFGGLDLHDMKELLHTGLTDDNKAETFDIRYTYNDLIFPIQYVKICPIATFGANFNYSIWYIELKGIKDEALMSQVYDAFNSYKEMETIRLCLKHFRQKNMMDVYATLKKKTSVQLEHPILTRLHQTLVLDGDFDAAESIIEEADNQHGVFQPYVQDARYLSTWQRIDATNDDGDSPCARGGHQLCLDAHSEKIYLFGGWDGKRELSDFWCYQIKEKRWKLLSQDTSKQGGPCPISCHTMCFDPIRKSIYVLGRYIESKPTATVSTEPKPIHESEFYQYFTELDRWIKISENTEIDGGPPLLFDHQMCVDPVSRTLFVLGGRIVSNETANSPHTYSGFYAYNMDECSWRILRHDIAAPTASTATSNTTPATQLLAVNDIPIGRRRSSNGSYVFPQHQDSTTTIKSRAGHALLLDSTHRHLYIFGGQRFRESLTDLLCYHLDTGTLQEIAQDFVGNQAADEVAYTQRAAIDTTRQELIITLGYLCNNNNATMTRTCGWVYRIQQNTWEKVFELGHNGPCARYTHQWVFNPRSNSHYMFGGNPGDTITTTKRLDDLWELKLQRPDTTQIVRKCKYLLRSRRLLELCKLADDNDSTSKGVSQATQRALYYLRNYMDPIIDQENEQEIKEFRRLSTHVCLCLDAVDKHQQSKELDSFSERTNVFQALLAFFPDHMKEPEGTLIDAVKIT